MIKRKLLSILLIILSAVLVVNVSAQDTPDNPDNSEEISELEEKIAEYEKKLDKLADKEESLAKEIEYADSQINLTELRIENSRQKLAQKETQIKKLGEDIEDLKARIEKLAQSIIYQGNVLNERMRARYKTLEESPLVVIFGSNTLDKIIQKSTYLKVMELQDHKLIKEMGETKDAYGKQKTLFEDSKKKEEELRTQIVIEKSNLETYQNQLASQRAEKQQLLSLTQNDEAKYQRLLEEARKELQSYSNFTQSAGGGAIGENGFGKGEKGWYFSQRDSRWANYRIGHSNYTVMEVGCLITSVAMVHKRYGEDIDPRDIAGDASNFILANMLIPWPAPPGKSYNAISISNIKNELDKDRPVIVGVYAGPYGTHFVVLADTDDGDYVMYDPWYGPDLKFSDYYSTGSIFQAVVFK